MSRYPRSECGVGVRTHDECHVLNNLILEYPICCVGETLPAYIKNNRDIFGLGRESTHYKRYTDNLCFLWCMALHQACDRRCLEQAVTKLYIDNNRDVAMDDLEGITIDDLYREETTFKTNVCVNVLVETDEGKTTTELGGLSFCHYPEMLNVNMYETHFS